MGPLLVFLCGNISTKNRSPKKSPENGGFFEERNGIGCIYIYRERESVFLGRFDVFLEDLIWETLMPVLVFLGGAKLGHNENEASIYIP